MKMINIRPVEIIGSCPAHLTQGDEFQIDELKLVNSGNVRICFLAISHLPPSVWQLQSEGRFFAHVSCPGCTRQLAEENRVVFLLGHTDKWDLCQAISEYRRLTRERPEPESAQQLRTQAMQAQCDGDFSQAALKMKAALDELKKRI
ncbi:MAG TPA: hypothetical protein VF352_09225 [Anaerolineales bacterium]